MTDRGTTPHIPRKAVGGAASSSGPPFHVTVTLGLIMPHIELHASIHFVGVTLSGGRRSG